MKADLHALSGLDDGTAPDDFDAAAAPDPQPAAPRAGRGRLPLCGEDLSEHRQRLASWYGERYDLARGAVAGALPELRVPSARALREREESVADLAAVHLYLQEEWTRGDQQVPVADSDEHDPLPCCVMSGLRRLPAHRGAAFVGTHAVSGMSEWFGEGSFVTDPGFWTASESSRALGPGGAGFAVWSLTGRRTGALEPHAPGRLLFLPGTRFKVLRSATGPHPRFLLRELFPQEAAGRRLTAAAETAGRWLDESTVHELESAIDASASDRFPLRGDPAAVYRALRAGGPPRGRVTAHREAERACRMKRSAAGTASAAAT